MDNANRIIASLLEDVDNGTLVLPTLPGVATAVRRVAQDPKSRTSDFVKIIETDAALAARIIQIANSPLTRGTRSVDDLQMAITRIGLKVLPHMVTGLVMGQIFKSTIPGINRRLRDVWEQSTRIGTLARHLAAEVGIGAVRPDVAYLGGLLADIGKLPLLMHLETLSSESLEQAEIDALIEQYHAALGERILKSWNFPDDLACAAKEHHNPHLAGDRPTLVDCIVVAAAQAQMERTKPHASFNWEQVASYQRLGLTTQLSAVRSA